jgi:hypothetical protein
LRKSGFGACWRYEISRQSNPHGMYMEYIVEFERGWMNLVFEHSRFAIIFRLQREYAFQWFT